MCRYLYHEQGRGLLTLSTVNILNVLLRHQSTCKADPFGRFSLAIALFSRRGSEWSHASNILLESFLVEFKSLRNWWSIGSAFCRALFNGLSACDVFVHLTCSVYLTLKESAKRVDMNEFSRLWNLYQCSSTCLRRTTLIDSLLIRHHFLAYLRRIASPDEWISSSSWSCFVACHLWGFVIRPSSSLDLLVDSRLVLCSIESRQSQQSVSIWVKWWSWRISLIIWSINIWRISSNDWIMRKSKWI